MYLNLHKLYGSINYLNLQFMMDKEYEKDVPLKVSLNLSLCGMHQPKPINSRK